MRFNTIYCLQLINNHTHTIKKYQIILLFKIKQKYSTSSTKLCV